MDRAGIVVLASVGLLLGVAFAARRLLAADATIFWDTAQRAQYYDPVWASGVGGSYVYPPPLAQVAGLLPWPAFIVGWTPLLFVGWWAATREWSLPTFVASAVMIVALGYAFPLTNALDLTLIGNPQILIAAVCVVGFRYPAAWAFVLLTKVAPGVGLLWFAVRREWRSLGIALAATAVIAGVSFAMAPGAWADYLAFITANATTPSPEPVVPIPWLVRLPMSVALVVWGALTNRRWTVPVAAGWASLALYEWSYLTVWMATLPLLGHPGNGRNVLLRA